MKQQNRLIQTQSQNLKLSESMKLSLAFLQMSVQELKETLEKELSENPIAEVEICYFQGNDQFIEAVADTSNGIEELLNQLRFRNKKIPLTLAELILANCDNSGYLKTSLRKLASVSQFNEKEIEAVRQEIMRCEPYGIAAFDLKECLLIQVELVHSKNKVLKQLIRHHLEDIAQGKLETIAHSCKIPTTQVQDQIKLLRSLNPRPGLTFDFTTPLYLRPDLKFYEEDGHIKAKAIEYFTIKYQHFDLNRIDDHDRQYLKEQEKRAKEIENCLKKRSASLVLIGQAMADIQSAYLLHGHCREILKLKDLAELTGLHETTISRALKGKAYEYGNQVFELRSLLNKEINELSADYCKQKISELIRNETTAYSDQALCRLLQEAGITISRRTIAKYRQELNIPSGVVRERLKKYENEY